VAPAHSAPGAGAARQGYAARRRRSCARKGRAYASREASSMTTELHGAHGIRWRRNSHPADVHGLALTFYLARGAPARRLGPSQKTEARPRENDKAVGAIPLVIDLPCRARSGRARRGT
ncbi:unnamed protein product, partial [Amoebophrya sp. A120]